MLFKSGKAAGCSFSAGDTVTTETGEREAGCLDTVPEILAHDAEKKVFGSTGQLLPMPTAVQYCTK